MTLATYAHIAITEAEAFLDLLNANFDDEGGRLFRGVSDSEKHELVPTALRTDRPAFDGLAATNQEQLEKEGRAALRFYDAAYFQGLEIPHWPQVRDVMDRFRQHPPVQWPGSPRRRTTSWRSLNTTGPDSRTRLDPRTRWSRMSLRRGSEGHRRWPSGSWTSAYDLPKAGLGFGLPTRIAVPYDADRNAHAQRGVFTLQQSIAEQDMSKEPSVRR